MWLKWMEINVLKFEAQDSKWARHPYWIRLEKKYSKVSSTIYPDSLLFFFLFGQNQSSPSREWTMCYNQAQESRLINLSATEQNLSINKLPMVLEQNYTVVITKPIIWIYKPYKSTSTTNRSWTPLRRL